MNRASRRHPQGSEALKLAAAAITGTPAVGAHLAAPRQSTKPYIFIATPMYGGMCCGGYAGSLFRIPTVFTQAQIQVVFSLRTNSSLITQARDDLAYEFLGTDCTHLMFIDSDIEFNAEDILSMIAANKDVILGLYPRKMIEWGLVAEAAKNGAAPQELHKYTGVTLANTLDGTRPTSRGPVEVTHGGCGFMLIKRQVLEGLAGKVPDYEAAFVMIGRTVAQPRMKQFFTSGIVDGCLLSEDSYFCKLARDNGYRVWAAPWVELTHTGSYTFTGCVR